MKTRWIGIDIGGTFIKGGLVDDEGRVLRRSRRESEPFDLDALVDTVVGLAHELGDRQRPSGLGIGAPGLVSESAVDFAPNMPALGGADLAGRVGSRMDLETVVRNDADMNAWGEFLAGAGRGARHVICITIGTGLGSGVIVDGKLHLGVTGYGAEAGHLVVDPDGLECGCGGRGCLETLVSAPAIVRGVAEAIAAGRETVLRDTTAFSAREVFEAAGRGDALAGEVLARTGRILGIGLTSMVNLLNPEIIIVGGGVAAAGSLILEPARREVADRAYAGLRRACRIVPAALGSDAGIVGAALFAREHSSSGSRRQGRGPAR